MRYTWWQKASFGVYAAIVVGVGIVRPTAAVILSLFAPLGVALLIYFRNPGKRQQRLRNGECVHCGYQLRESKGRCPECGRLIPPGTRTKRSDAH